MRETCPCEQAGERKRGRERAERESTPPHWNSRRLTETRLFLEREGGERRERVRERKREHTSTL